MRSNRLRRAVAKFGLGERLGGKPKPYGVCQRQSVLEAFGVGQPQTLAHQRGDAPVETAREVGPNSFVDASLRDGKSADNLERE